MNAHIYSFVFLAVFGMAYALTECPVEDGEQAVSAVNPSDCNSFYLCRNGEYVLMSCPTGLQYNEELGVCDWAVSANCLASAAAEEQAEDEVQAEVEAEVQAEAEAEVPAEAEAEAETEVKAEAEAEEEVKAEAEAEAEAEK